MSVKLIQNSYLRFADLYSYQGYEFFDVPDWPVFKPQDDDRFIYLNGGYINRPDLIAYDEYGDTELFWVICLANNIYAPPLGFYLNRKIRIPSLTYVKQIIRGTSV